MRDYYADLLYIQKRNTDFFNLWREGDEQVYNYDGDRRQHVLRQMPFPRRGRWPGHRKKNYPNGSRPYLYRIVKQRSHIGPDSRRVAAEDVAAGLGAALQFADLRLTKILGWGGLGIACAIEGHRASGEPIKVVYKAALDDEGMAEEKRNHILMAGAKHIVQRVVLADTAEEVQEPAGRNRQRMDASGEILMIEFMRHGDLSGILGKASVSNTPFPDLVLWQIFDCLFRGVVAMAFPGGWCWGDVDPENEQIKQQTECCEGRGMLNAVSNTMVHFDLDPLNVLVGDFDEEHSAAPVVKIADLGLAQNIDMQVRLKSQKMWRLRQYGKVNIYTPEQFAEEWDYIAGAPIYHPDRTERETAGNYHWWSNMYQVAQVMFELITLCHLEWPPVLEQYYEDLADGSKGKRWSYGTALLADEFDHVDLTLRQVVAACMNHNPLERPLMAELDEVIREHVGTHEPSAQERLEVQHFWDRILGEPPSAAESQPADLAGVVAAAEAAAAQATPRLAAQVQSVPGRGQDAPPLSFCPGATRVDFRAAPATKHRGQVMPCPDTAVAGAQEKKYDLDWWW